MTRFLVPALGALMTSLLAAGCRPPSHDQPDTPPAASAHRPTPVALTSAANGHVFLVDRQSLALLRTVEPRATGEPDAPMLVVEDPARRAFYVGNFDKGLGRIPMDGGDPKVLPLPGALIGSALSPDGRLLAVNGARDLTLRLVDLDAWKLVASTRLGDPDDPPRHSHMTHGLASTHPAWLPDGSAVLTQDNIHEEVVLIGRDGKERARRRLRSGVHAFLTTGPAEVLALAEGTVDGQEPPRVVVLRTPSLQVVREVVIPLQPNEPAKLHHAALSPDGQVLVVANMGPMHGDRAGSTVAAVRWRTGEVLWHRPTVRNAGHVRFLADDRVIVLGHRARDLPVLNARTGEALATWALPGALQLGHSLAAEPAGTVLVINSSTGQLVRLGDKGPLQQSPRLGEGVAEASLPE